MNTYKIFETNQFIKQLNRLSGKTKQQILDKLFHRTYPQLKTEPHYGQNIKKLVNWKPGTWRYRIQNYRLFYEINEKEKIVSIITIDTRQNAYK